MTKYPLKEELTTPHLMPSLDIKELDFCDKGIRLKYERFNKARKEEGYYPKRGELSSNYSSRIDDNLSQIARELLVICGLDSETWLNISLKIKKLSFFETQDINGTKSIAISAKLESVNEILNSKVSFSCPKISYDVILESNLKTAIVELISDLKDFYYGEVKYEQNSLFEVEQHS